MAAGASRLGSGTDGGFSLRHGVAQDETGVERKFGVYLNFFALAGYKVLIFTANGATFFFDPIA
jgi:hypothetical protein